MPNGNRFLNSFPNHSLNALRTPIKWLFCLRFPIGKAIAEPVPELNP